MHPNALKRIESHIDKCLQACSVQDTWLSFDSCEKEIFSLSKEVIKYKKEWLTVSNCYSIFFDHIHSYLKRKFSDSEVTGKLVELTDEKEILELKTIILDFIASIPRSYEIYFPLPSFKDSEINDIELSDSLFIKKFNEGDTLPGGIADGWLNLLTGGKNLEVGTTYLIVKASGYIKNCIDDIAFRESLSSLKQVLHMCLILNLMKLQEPAISFGPSSMGLYNHTLTAAIIDLSNRTKISNSIMLPLSLASHINRLVPNTSSKKFIDAKQYGEEGIRKLFVSNMKETSNLIKANDTDAQFVKSGIEWAFDSQIEENETISFIQVSIGLEAILGEETGGEPLTETLADRCAYLLGNTMENR